MSRIDCNEIVKRMEERLSADYQIELHEASTVQLHNALAEAVMAVTAKDCRESRRAHERVRRQRRPRQACRVLFGQRGHAGHTA